MDEEKEGVSIGDIFRTVFSQKWLALIITVVITLVGTLGLYLVYSPAKTRYESTFSVNLATYEEVSSVDKSVTVKIVKYPNGQAFNYRELVSKSNLQAVKDSGGETFSKVDVDKMYKNGAVSITQKVSEAGEITYTVSFLAKYFPSTEVASQFIDKITNTPTRVVSNWVNGLANETQETFEDKIGNEAKLEFLKSQITAIKERFSELNGLPITATEKVNDLDEKAKRLEGLLHKGYYEPSAEVLEGYVYAISGLQSELQIAQKVLDSLVGAGAGATQGEAASAVVMVGADIENYAIKVAKLEQQISIYQSYLEKYESDGEYNIPESIDDDADSKAFTKSLEELLNDVKSLTAKYECDYYSKISLVSYDGKQISAEGGMSIVIAIVLSFVVGLIIAGIVAYIVGWNVQKKAKAAVVVEASAEAQKEEGAENKQ